MSGANLCNPYRFPLESISLVQSAHGSVVDNATSVAATFGASPTENNLLVACVQTLKNGNAGISTPAGWTQIFQTINGFADGENRTAMFYKIAGASESSTVTVNASGGADWESCGLVVLEFENIAASPLDVSQTNWESGNGLTASTGTTAATSQADEVAVAICAFMDDDFTIPGTWTGSYTEVWSENITDTGGTSRSLCIGVAYKILSATGTQNTTYTVTVGGAEERSSGIATFKAA